MIEEVSKHIEVFSLKEKVEINPAVDAVLNGKITLLRVGSVFSLVVNPGVAGLAEKLSFLKERNERQTMSVVCTYEQAKRIVDKNRVNPDFFRLSPYFCGKVIVRLPIDTTVAHPFPYNYEDGTMQFLDFAQTHPIRSAFAAGLADKGCKYLSITSGNIHGASTIEDLESAKMLAALFNIKAAFFGMIDETVVTDIPGDTGSHKGSYIILSFCNPNVIEVKRLANKTDRDVTERTLKELFAEIRPQTPVVYAL
ncbi:MAG: hypothetical protein FWE62_04905 [Firmicutes bacterium]|nr:hypothetical protein [Bacillota bacterium]